MHYHMISMIMREVDCFVSSFKNRAIECNTTDLASRGTAIDHGKFGKQLDDGNPKQRNQRRGSRL